MRKMAGGGLPAPLPAPAPHVQPEALPALPAQPAVPSAQPG